jgi:hypothetical protein
MPPVVVKKLYNRELVSDELDVKVDGNVKFAEVLDDNSRLPH